jgi:hypothetical protein
MRASFILAAMALVTACTGSPTHDDSPGLWTAGALEQLLEQVGGETSDTPDDSMQEVRIEELVATCMKEQGFDYVPNPLSVAPENSATEPDLSPGTMEFAQQYGYGISIGAWGSSIDADGTLEDPNQRYRDSMSDGELAEYESALYGSTTDAETAYAWEDAGCYGAAEHAVIGDQSLMDPAGGIEQEVARFWATIQDDPRLVEIDRQWSACMAGRGYSGLSDPGTAPAELWLEYTSLGAAPESSPTQRADFADREIGQAVADLTCQNETDFIAESLRVDHELQQEFVDTHRGELEIWVAASEG